MSELVAEATARTVNLRVTFENNLEYGSLYANQGQTFEVAPSIAPALLRELKKGSLFLRLSRPEDVIIRAPKRLRDSWTLAEATETYGAAVQPRALELCLRHSGPFAFDLRQRVAQVEGVHSWLDYAVHEKVLELNAELDKELALCREALEEVRGFQVKQEEILLKQAEADAAAARQRMKAAQKVATAQTLDELQEELHQAEAQVEVFARCAVEPEKMDRARQKLEAAQKAIADRAHEAEHSAAALALEPIRRELDRTPSFVFESPKFSGFKDRYEAAQAALSAGDFPEVYRLVQELTAPAPGVGMMGNVS
jgi:hypothetical protein